MTSGSSLAFESNRHPGVTSKCRGIREEESFGRLQRRAPYQSTPPLSKWPLAAIQASTSSSGWVKEGSAPTSKDSRSGTAVRELASTVEAGSLYRETPAFPTPRRKYVSGVLVVLSSVPHFFFSIKKMTTSVDEKSSVKDQGENWTLWKRCDRGKGPRGEVWGTLRAEKWVCN